MTMKGNVLLAALLVPGMFMMQSGVAAVAVVDLDRAVANTQEGKDAISKLNAFRAERRTAIETKAKAASDLANRLRTQGRVITESAREQLAQQLDTAQTEIETMQEDAQNKLDQMTRDLLAPVERKTAAAVTAYATERGLKIVLDASTLQGGLLYVHDTADITSEIIRRIAANWPESGPRNALAVPSQNAGERFQRQVLRGKRFDSLAMNDQPNVLPGHH